MQEKEGNTEMSSKTAPSLKQIAFILVPATALGFVFNWFFFGRVPGVSLPIFTVLALAGAFAAARAGGVRVRHELAAPVAIMLFAAGMVAIRAGALLGFLDVVALLYASAFLLYALFKPDITRYTGGDYTVQVLRLWKPVARKFGAAMSGTQVAGRLLSGHKNLRQVLRGVVIALPVLVIFGLLLASADLVFRKLAENIFHFHLSGNVVPQAIIFAFVTFWLIGAFAYASN